MKKLILFLSKLFFIAFTLFGILGICIMLANLYVFGIVFFIFWSVLGLFITKLLFKYSKQILDSSTHNVSKEVKENHSSQIKDFLETSNSNSNENNTSVRNSNKHSSFSLNFEDSVQNNINFENPDSDFDHQKRVSEHYKIAGTSYRQKEIESLGIENELYNCSKSELIDDYIIDEKIYQYDFFDLEVSLIEEPDNAFDPNAIKVVINGVHVGYIKKGSCSHIKKLIHQQKIVDITAEIGGGKYKYISSDYDYEKEKDVYRLEKNTTNYFVSIDLTINL